MHANLSTQEVIDIHSSEDYLIYMLGFLPGFSYLGGLDERIHTPRLANPRIKIPAGSVGIGGSQTGDYIHFVPVTEKDFLEIKEQVNQGTYECVIRQKGV